nr:translation initiation factor IF-2 N-terminal domain-containing protein [Tomitella gaofuii]
MPPPCGRADQLVEPTATSGWTTRPGARGDHVADKAPPEEQNIDSAATVEIPVKLRVHALAKLLGVTSKEVLAKLTELGEEVRTAHSSVTRDQGERVRDAFAPAAAAPATPAAVETPAQDEPPQKAQPRKSQRRKPAPATATETAATPEPATPPAAEAPATVEAGDAKEGDAPEGAGSPAFVAPLFLQPDPDVRSQAPQRGQESASDDRPAEETRDGQGADDGTAEDTADESEGGSGRSSRRRRRGRRGRGRGRGEQNGDKPQNGSDDAAAAGADTGDGAGSGDDASAGKKDDPAREGHDEAAADAAGAGTASDGGNGKGGRSGKSRRGGRSGGVQDSGGGAGKSGAKGGKPDAADGDATPAESDEGDGGAQGTDGNDGDDNGNGEGNGASSRRRRRRRRRRGGDGDGSSQDDPPNTVVHEREPRSKRSSRDEVQGISGSTRLEAKRQRRRDGREAGRRRPPILSEAEFLARREAVDRVMVVREKPADDGRDPITQVGVLEDKVLVEHFVTSTATPSMVGNVYLGRVQNVLPSMEAAFVDIGRGRNGVLYAGEVDWAAAGLGGSARKIEQALKPGDQVVVQVTKDPVGHKGARLTTQISMAGRFLVYVPRGTSTGISRKLPDTERKRLKSILRQIVPDDAGVIIRTASEGVSEDELRRDVDRLQALWEEVKVAADEAKAAKSTQPKALYEEPDLLVKVIRDLFNEDFGKLVIEGDGAWGTVSSYIERVAPDLMERVERYDRNGSSVDVFAAYRIDEQLAKALERKVWLPSGGTLIIDRTEAMTVVDVNTGKFTGSGGNLEETVTRNNLEAAEEVVRQMRLRDIGGMIVVDFIDMVLESNRDLVLRRLTEALGRDRTRHQVSEVTSLGLVQMTRKRLGTGLVEAFSTPCEHCHGRGLVLHEDPIVAEPDTGGQGKGESRRGRKSSKKSGGGGQQPPKETKEAQKQTAHHHSEHPMFKAMAEAGPAEDEPHGGPAASGPRGAADSKATAESKATADDEDPREGKSGGADKSAAIAKIEAAVARSTGPRRRRARRPQGGGSEAEGGQEPRGQGDAAEADTASAPARAPMTDATAASGATAGKTAAATPESPAAEAVEEAAVRGTAAHEREAATPEPAVDPGAPAASRRRSRRASRPAAAPSEHGAAPSEPIRSEIIVQAPPPAAAAASDDASGDGGGPVASAPQQAPVRRPRRRAAVRRAGPPEDGEE